MALTWKTYIQYFAYLFLVFFFIPIRISGPNGVEIKFEEYVKTFNKTYKNATIYQKRLEAFKISLSSIEALNDNKTGSATYGLTKFSDLSQEEFVEMVLHPDISKTVKKRHKKLKHKGTRRSLPGKLDWRTKKVVGEIHTGGVCGGGHATVETIDSRYAMQFGKILDLSVEQTISCSRICKTGDFCSLLAWMKTTNFTLLPKKAPLTCPFEGFGARIDDFICDNFVESENTILEILTKNGPIVAAINAKTWQHYIGGVIQHNCGGEVESLNHAVEIVGYDLTDHVPFYIVRNSWGVDWGHAGYAHVAVERNMCGLANQIAALTVM